MAKQTNSTWQFRVVKRAHGGDGKWFDYPTAATFSTEDEAKAYAAQFAAEQRAAGMTGFGIDVRSRRGTCGFGRGALVATYKV